MSEYLARAEGGSALDLLEAHGWDDLARTGRFRDPLRSASWLRLWAERWSGGVTPRAVVVVRDGRAVAAAPLEVRRRGGLRVVRHLAHADAWFHAEPPARDAAARSRLMQALAAERGDILLLDGMPDDEATVAAVRACLPGARITPGETWRLRTAAPPRSVRKRRKEVRRAVRRAADQGVEVTTAWYAAWDDIAPRVDGLLEFHHRHFPDEMGENQLAAPGERRAYVADAIARMGREGRVRLAEVRLDGDALAAWDMAFVGDDGCAVAYAGAFDRGRTDLLNLGWISMLEMVERLTEEGVEVIDFGSWPAPYKDLISEPVPIMRVVAPLSARGRAALAARDAARAASGLVSALRARRAGGHSAPAHDDGPEATAPAD